jgi:hypothetical protein
MKPAVFAAAVGLIISIAGTGTVAAEPCRDTTRSLGTSLATVDADLNILNLRTLYPANVTISRRIVMAPNEWKELKGMTTLEPGSNVSVRVTGVNDWIFKTDITTSGNTFRCSFTITKVKKSEVKGQSSWKSYGCTTPSGAPFEIVCSKSFNSQKKQWNTVLKIMDTPSARPQ